ncbi:MAG: hypothetical protein D6689_22065 [Deltaproteobacteria bacterium]|nr:MAG: hypothetical protein D6689_22065 [Deltaproteobacteria bacterium]
MSALAAGCAATTARRPSGPPPADPIASVSAAELAARGRAYARAGDLVRAEQYLAAALAKGGDDRDIVPQLVEVCVAGSRLRAAIAHADSYLARHPGDAGMRYVLGALRWAAGDRDGARAELRRALELAPRLADAEFALGQIAVEQDDDEAARRHMARYLALAPSGRHAREARALVGARPRPVELAAPARPRPVELATPARPRPVELATPARPQPEPAQQEVTP